MDAESPIVALARQVTESVLAGPMLPDDYEFMLTVTVTAGEVRALCAAVDALRRAPERTP